MPFILRVCVKACLNCPLKCPETSHCDDDDWHPCALVPQRLKKAIKSRQHRTHKAWGECCHFSSTVVLPYPGEYIPRTPVDA